MNDCVKTFGELPDELYSFAGGKEAFSLKCIKAGILCLKGL